VSGLTPNPWDALRGYTPARIALGRAGGSLPTEELLAFAAAHAAARDAVQSELDGEQLRRELASAGLPMLHVHSAAADRVTYLQRPDLGRRLDEASRAAVMSAAGGARDVAVIVADGLSATAAQQHGGTLVKLLLDRLRGGGISVGPIAIARQARVALEDEIGELLKARAAIILIGERPGLSAADSLGAYVVFGPQVGNTDAVRNCVSNIRPGGLPLTAAAETIAYLVRECLRKKLSGVGLTDERGIAELT
jgi:ethanolamine ammonia-lyase small subunit